MTEPRIERRLSTPIRKYDNEFSARTALVGRSPWTAVGPLADLGGTKASRADKGVRPTRRNTSRYLRIGVLSAVNNRGPLRCARYLLSRRIIPETEKGFERRKATWLHQFHINVTIFAIPRLVLGGVVKDILI